MPTNDPWAELNAKYSTATTSPAPSDAASDDPFAALNAKYAQPVVSNTATQEQQPEPQAQIAPQPQQKPNTGLETGRQRKRLITGQIRNSPMDIAADQAAGNLTAGMVRGAGSIGSTALGLTLDPLARLSGLDKTDFGLVTGLGKTMAERRAGMDGGLQIMGAQPDSALYKTGKIAGEIAGTAGVGGALANGARAVGASAPIVQGLMTGGLNVAGKTGPMGIAIRGLTGAATGAAAAGMVDPAHAKDGAIIGAALPVGGIALAKGGRLVGQGAAALAKNTLGMATGAGAETFGTAYRAGKTGSKTFVDNMRGNVPMTDVLDDAKNTLSQMRIERGNQYRSGMVDIANDKTVIDFAPIDGAVQSLKKMGSFKGQTINKNASGTVDEITSIVENWKGLDPDEYHTPEGLDALKKAIGDIRDATQFGTPGRRAADTAYNAVKAQIDSQAPTYAKVMKDYSQASDTLQEIEKALSLGNKASADTSMRKLQSLMRNNVNTNYGNRLELAGTLEKNGADIMNAVAGQAASSLTPRGLQGLAATGAGVAGFTNPATLALLPFTSPRMMGELAYGLGSLSRGAGNVSGKVAGKVIPQGLLTQAPMMMQNGLLGVSKAAPVLIAQ